ncbi:hypothetical protein VTJ04DRAFT_3871 [Mycothermus thermophilus]|uniref:uncharacterized protein n=1 Tax=Humicola insolens TaxID=85995 RepID=UPI00374256CE
MQKEGISPIISPPTRESVPKSETRISKSIIKERKTLSFAFPFPCLICRRKNKRNPRREECGFVSRTISRLPALKPVRGHLCGPKQIHTEFLFCVLPFLLPLLFPPPLLICPVNTLDLCVNIPSDTHSKLLEALG